MRVHLARLNVLQLLLLAQWHLLQRLRLDVGVLDPLALPGVLLDGLALFFAAMLLFLVHVGTDVPLVLVEVLLVLPRLLFVLLHEVLGLGLDRSVLNHLDVVKVLVQLL